MKKIEAKKEYNIPIDYLRVLAILAVIFIHTTTKTLEVGNYDIQHLGWSLFLNQIFRFAVPLFFLISGFVLELNYRSNLDYKTYFKKRISKILIPYLFWSIFYNSIIFKFPIDLSFLYQLLAGDASYQLYFIPTLLIFYILFPFIHHIKKFIVKRTIIIPLLIIEVILLSVDYYHHVFFLLTPIRIALLNFAPFLLGIIACHHEKAVLQFVKQKFWFLLLLLIILMGAVFYESYLYYFFTKNLDAIYSQYRPLMLLYTLVLGSLLYFVFFTCRYYQKTILYLSRLSFFVFFVHVAILYLYWYTIGIRVVTASHGKILEQLWYDPFVFLFVTCLSFAIAAICHKIPKLRLLTG